MKNSKLAALLTAGLIGTLAGTLTGTLAHAGTIGPLAINAPWWMGRHQALVQLAQQGHIQVLMLGDSITDFWSNWGTAEWSSELAPLGAANFGIGGDLIDNVLWRIENGELNGVDPRIAEIQIGTNNIGRDSTAEISAGIARLVTEVRARLPHAKILLFGIFPRNDNYVQPFKGEIPVINEATRRLADNRTVFFMNIDSELARRDGSLVPGLYREDQEHLTQAGYVVWADALVPELKRLLAMPLDGE